MKCKGPRDGCYSPAGTAQEPWHTNHPLWRFTTVHGQLAVHGVFSFVPSGGQRRHGVQRPVRSPAATHGGNNRYGARPVRVAGMAGTHWRKRPVWKCLAVTGGAKFLARIGYQTYPDFDQAIQLTFPGPSPLICPHSQSRMWRNWQTRKVQVLVSVKDVEVRVLSSASNLKQPSGLLFLMASAPSTSNARPEDAANPPAIEVTTWPVHSVRRPLSAT